jgi:hypothetical protein
MAGAIDTLVRVGLLSVNATIVFDVLKCLGWKASAAPEIVVRTSTVNQLLLGKGDVLSSGLSICCLKCSSSAEGPAGTAVGLVFYWANDPVLPPVFLQQSTTSLTLNNNGIDWYVQQLHSLDQTT